MDEQELRSLFSAAPGDAPEPSFSQDDVVRESRRQTVRRRNRITAGVSAAALVVAGFGLSGQLSGDSSKSMTAADHAVPAQGRPGATQPGDGPMRPEIGGESPNFSSRSPQQGGAGDGKTGPLAEGASGCEQVDGELAIALAGELPGHFADQAVPGGACSTVSRSAGFPVPGGEVAAALYPKGVPEVFKSQPAGTVTARIGTASGGVLVLVSVPSAGSAAPYAGQVDRFARDLAPRF
ncbi:hypothetical protein AMES_8936 [Amycolatopsis mediterranei S699]|uniref:Uncharacterized protein n=2 Tax=Amycolatopsis mediterranei TaxID=33910 RepID=A0A0H3DKM2_AMYMU|nr:hypothetical protein [Amycolatopsis mediterranei]ADJ50762.1 hypothetical protein AMED_9073 [Amycolatopsis mediterranei U32]AEK47772.1 hypothetical protein RAM_46535 [Amycolatopsis mediterranei S699]AFO82468.1 hypothetical protein AMES_8936 [Amycolatopsis mediterranei S699]AGT89597.1 hypothetical protein B737_8937 [Amycolatopsis mediterranei RB]UZF75657.1 hypothetical protein ISP_009274 [Amycolatopsis mediterranei]